MESTGLSASDVALLNGGNMNGGGSWMWILIIVVLFMFCGNRGNCDIPNNVATTQTVNEGFNFAALERQNNEIVQAVESARDAINNTVKDGNYNISNEIRDLETATNHGFSEAQKTHTEILRTIDRSNYESALRDSEIKQLIKDENAATRLMMKDDKIEALQQKVNYLELTNVVGQATCGIVRYPNSMAYNAGTSPFCQCPQTGCCNR